MSYFEILETAILQKLLKLIFLTKFFFLGFEINVEKQSWFFQLVKFYFYSFKNLFTNDVKKKSKFFLCIILFFSKKYFK